MQWDPAVDILLQPDPGAVHRARRVRRQGRPEGRRPRRRGRDLKDLATGLGPEDAFVIFPEGGNMTSTPPPHAASIGCARRGATALADRAEAMVHVMPPQPGGMHAALEASADADVVFIAHTGLDRLVTLGRHLARAADGQADHDARLAGAARGDPGRPDAQAEWLFDWFERHRPLDQRATTGADRGLS